MDNKVSKRSKLLVEMCFKQTEWESRAAEEIDNSVSYSNDNQPIISTTVPPNDSPLSSNMEEYPIGSEIFHTLEISTATLFGKNNVQESMDISFVNSSTDEGLPIAAKWMKNSGSSVNDKPIILITVPPDVGLLSSNVKEYTIDSKMFHATYSASDSFEHSANSIIHVKPASSEQIDDTFLDKTSKLVLDSDQNDKEENTQNLDSQAIRRQEIAKTFSDKTRQLDSESDLDDKEETEQSLDSQSGRREEIAETFPDETRQFDSEGDSDDKEENDQSLDSRSRSSEEGNTTTKKRKRKPVKALWMRDKNKRLRERGLQYTGFKKDEETKKYQQNAPKTKRSMGQPCNSNLCKKSKLRSCSTISEETRRQLFEKFWKMTWDQRKIYVVNNITLSSVKRRYTKNENSSRNVSMFYSLTMDGQKLNVCKKLFLSTLSLGEFQVSSWVKTAKHGMHESREINNENRVAHLRLQKNVDKEFLIKFLNDLPTLPSHYCRKSSSKSYLDQTVASKTALYKEYVSKCQTESKNSMSRRTFDDLFEEKNLALYQPKKDKCDLCCQYEVGNLEEEVFARHIAKKDRARLEKENDVKLAQDSKAVVLMMDLQAVKVCLSLNASSLYYKTKLCCHNFTVMNVQTKHVMCYWFSEVESDLCASTFASLLVDYISRFTDNSLPILIYSDGCTYQNRNNIMANALLFLSVTRNQTIKQKYLERGHTQMQCDSVHSRVEAKIKETREIYLPSTYLSISREARKNPFPYSAEWVTYSLFRDFSQKGNQMYASIRPGKNNVTDIRNLKYTSDGTIFYKLTFDDAWTDLPQRRCRKEVCLVWPQLNLEQRKIKAQKYKHLQELKPVIPADCHHFYDNLRHI